MWTKVVFLALLIPSWAFTAETVYCIHGFMRKPSSMKKMAISLEKEGYQVKRWGYPSKDKIIQEHAEDLVVDLKLTARAHPGEEIHFVTHSLGGIIVRAALNHPDCPEEAKIGKAVLLAPPNQGARFGHFLSHIGSIRKFLGPKAGQQLLFCVHFDPIGKFPDTKQILVISGTCGFNPIIGEKNDGKVGVTESCLKTPHSHLTYFVGHSWIMYSDSVIKTATQFIKD